MSKSQKKVPSPEYEVRNLGPGEREQTYVSQEHRGGGSRENAVISSWLARITM